MMSANLFLIMASIAIIFLFIACISATMGAIDVGTSPTISNYYSHVAWILLGISAILGWMALLAGIVLLITGGFLGGFRRLEEYQEYQTLEFVVEDYENELVTLARSRRSKNNTKPKNEEAPRSIRAVDCSTRLGIAYRKEEDLIVSELASLFIMVGYIFITLVSIIVGVGLVVASLSIQESGLSSEAWLSGGYTWSITGATCAFICALLLIIATIAFAIYMSDKHQILDRIRGIINNLLNPTPKSTIVHT